MRSFLQFILALATLTAAAHAQSTAFTYQGQLRNSGQPAAGLHDLRFALFDAASGGTQVGTVQCADNILVSDGLFTATIDFGQQYATPAPRFLEVEVRADTGLTCANLAGFVILGQRQSITPTPMAAHAKSASTAFSLSAPDGSPANAVAVDNAGRVGIGTEAPLASLHIASDLDAVMVLQDTGPNSTQSGFVSFKNGSGAETAWVGYGTPGSPHFSIVNARSGGNLALLPLAGNVGIGTTTPTVKLEVHGDIRLGSSGQLRAPGGEDNLRIIRGTISAAGAVWAGSGWTVSRPSTGVCVVTYNTPFPSAGDPTVVVSSSSFGVAGSCMLGTQSSTGFTVRTFDQNNAAINSAVSFMALGNR